MIVGSKDRPLELVVAYAKNSYHTSWSDADRRVVDNVAVHVSLGHACLNQHVVAGGVVMEKPCGGARNWLGDGAKVLQLLGHLGRPYRAMAHQVAVQRNLRENQQVDAAQRGFVDEFLVLLQVAGVVMGT